MAHLTPEQFVDLLERDASAPVSAGRESEAARHVSSCEACRRELEGLRRAFTAAVESDEFVEPSPLFWDHFPARVRAAIPTAAPASRWRLRVGWQAWVAAAAVAVAVVVSVSVRWPLGENRSPGNGASVGNVASVAGGASVAGFGTAVATSAQGLDDGEDPSLVLLGELAAGVGWEAASESGLAATGAADGAVRDLSTAERRELQRLLEQELSQARSGQAEG